MSLAFLCCFWAAALAGSVSQTLFGYAGAVTPVLLAAVTLTMAVLGAVTLHDAGDWALVAVFAVLTVVSALVNHVGVMVTLSGLRDYIGLLFVMPVLRWLLTSDNAGRFRRVMDRNVAVFVAVNGALIVVQFMVCGACDKGSGLFAVPGAGPASVAQIVLTFYLVCRRWNAGRGYYANLRANWWMAAALLPVLLNETKVSLLMLPAVTLLLVPWGHGFWRRLAKALPLMLLTAVLSAAVYTAAVDDTSGACLFDRQYWQLYLGTDNRDAHHIATAKGAETDPDAVSDEPWRDDLPRLVKINAMDSVLHTTRGGILLGAGVGQTRQTAAVSPTAFAAANHWLLKGTRPMLLVVVLQLGIMGLAWFITATGYQSGLTASRRQRAAQPLMTRNVQLLFALTVAGILFYNDSMRTILMMIILLYPVASMTLAGHRATHTPDTGNHSNHFRTHDHEEPRQA